MIQYTEFISKMDENPYYPVPVSEYTSLFDFRLTSDGLVYFDRLRKEWNEKDLPEKETLFLGLLHLAYAVGIKSVKECKNWQAYIFLAGDVDHEAPGIKTTLRQLGCIEENPDYNPKLFKSHILWKHKMLSVIGCI